MMDSNALPVDVPLGKSIDVARVPATSAVAPKKSTLTRIDSAASTTNILAELGQTV